MNPDNANDYSYFINLILDFRSNNGPDVFRVSEEYASFKRNHDDANNGDLILVEPGIYNEQIDF